MPLDRTTDLFSAIGSAWGERSDARYEVLAAKFRPLFTRIREQALARELGRILPFE